ncbi:MAG: hypothetical protein ACLRO6_12230, partial [[Eubacterium] siraeum]
PLSNFCLKSVALDLTIYPAALTPLGATPQTPFSKIYRFFDSLRAFYVQALYMQLKLFGNIG